MIITYVDIEMEQPSQEIIEIGWFIGNPVTGKEVIKNNALINIGKPLSSFITSLTGIDDVMLSTAGTLQEACNSLLTDHRTYSDFMNPATWGGSDIEFIKSQLVDYPELLLQMNLGFGRRWIDVKTIYQAYRMAKQLSIKSGLAKSLTRVDLKFEGTKHRAADDAYNTFRIHRELLKRMA